MTWKLDQGRSFRMTAKEQSPVASPAAKCHGQVAVVVTRIVYQPDESDTLLDEVGVWEP
jgi:hypothetical protein